MGFLSSIGGLLNDLTGITSSSNAAFKQSKKLANLSFEQEKYFAGNAHQLEMNDLAQAGLNPALTTASSSAGSIASDGGTGNAGYTGSSASISPLDIVGTINTTRAVTADNKLKEQQGNAQEMYGLAQMVNALTGMKNLKWIDKQQKATLDETLKRINLIIEQTKSEKNKHPVLNRLTDMGEYKEPTEEERKKGILF